MTVEVLSVYIDIEFMATVVLLVLSYMYYMKSGQLHDAGHVMAAHNVVHGKFCSLLIFIVSVRSNQTRDAFCKRIHNMQIQEYYQPHDLILSSQN